ncbi:hypothetical protein K432DRAFT_386046 [Lepidopterella palustris CBS 459.81]|uniref:Transcription factor CBF/NF-Y/archaeal histone domain-containing protein n=1 Tax=Lepidopterella palustris CBS 459.81 TaxID=1314670 RepID=A0A8E2E1H7_9PEZI|nr:hypothetical protein K432DRAFT_386046 [Lepidopterella palustris CBS 459.81]
MESPDASSWAPQSPDLSGYHSSDLHQDPMHPQHQSHRGPILHSAPYPPPTLSPYNQSQVKSQYAPRSVKREREPRDEDGEYHPDASLSAVSSEKPSRARKVKMEENGMAEASTGGGRLAGTEGIEVKTKFPVARIKRIMQADDDVGKVAQVTPFSNSKSTRTLHDLPCHKSCSRSQTPLFETRHRSPPQTSRLQRPAIRLPLRHRVQSCRCTCSSREERGQRHGRRDEEAEGRGTEEEENRGR